jgi:ATP-binding cassette, subfamily A (ABC1), member 3
MGFSSHLKALLKRYHLCYFRIPGHFVADFTLAFIISGSLVAINALGNTIGALASLIYIILIPFTFMSVTRSMLAEIVFEKSSKLKEFLKLNGVSNLTYQCYTFLIVFGKVLLFSIMITAGVAVAYLFQNGDLLNANNMSFGGMMEIYLLGGLGTASFILLASTIFSDPKFASDIGAFFYVIFSLGSFAVLNTTNPTYYYLVSLFPQTALTMGIIASLNNNNSSPFRNQDINIDTFTTMLIVDFFAYLILYSYLDQVIADGNGVSKPWNFFLNCRKRKHVGLTNGRVPLLPNSVVHVEQDTSSAVYHEPFNNQSGFNKNVEIIDLKKEFDGNYAVNGVSMSVYQSQIICLLGHNGAGKTTTINMLTGLLEPSSGDVLYDGTSFYSDVEVARSKIGLCSQQDILFNKLTVREHLELIGALRNIPIEELDSAVNEALRRINLAEEQFKFSENISGGNKRKLSLAMAVIGRVKVLLLDEPTSGMDPQNRRIIWQDIRNLKASGLTLLMTTHHLDEAEELADRVAIMSKGRLLALGTSDYIKKTFGEGYYLTLTPNFQNMQNEEEFISIKQTIGDVVLKHIKGAKIDEKTPPDVLKYLLPFSAQSSFHSLFKTLELNPKIKFNMQMNSLEDTFVNIGLKEDEFLGIEKSGEHLNIDMQAPQSFSKPPVYDFGMQVKVIFLRKYRVTLRSLRNIILVILPGLLMLISAAGMGLYKDEPTFGFELFLFILGVSFALNSTAYCAYPVYEREEKLKYAMDVMGMRALPYWLGTLLFDIICVLVINLLSLIGYSIAYDSVVEFVNNHPNYGYRIPISPLDVFILTLPFSYSVVTYCYMWSFAFDKALTAVKYFPLTFYFIMYMGGSLILIVISNQLYQNSQSQLKASGLFEIMTFISYIICPVQAYNQALGSAINFYPSYIDSIAGYVILFFTLGTIYFIIVFKYDSKTSQFGRETLYQTIDRPEMAPIDYQEINSEVQRTNNSQTDTITVQGLVKQFGIFTAVKGVSFGVEPGQIFGLLGPNGAGKSTTFNILTALLPKTQGNVRLLGREVSRGQPDLYQNVGICPQFNCLWDILTVQEHLEFFAGLKGLSQEDTNESIKYFYEVLALAEHKNKKSTNLSGGNKRKLCVANCLMGSSSLLFFDEPSTGLDPLARRFLWGALQQSLKVRKASIVLTTHSMNEAESLSHKIGILVNGRFFCIGPTEYLKDKYGSGYKMTIQIPEGKPTVEGLIKSIFPTCKRLWDGSIAQETYEISAQGFLFSHAFERLGELKSNGTIRDFSIYNTTLEQVFISFSRYQYAIPPQPGMS